ncbi:hypothetical protein [Aeoliella mucimassa]|nr:hypothetical protein [Aeoliella mucimassa]
MARMICRLLGTILLLVGAFSASAQAQQPPKVTLERAELGFADRYRVGSWTPLRLTISGGEKTVTAIAQVAVPDSDGVYTSVNSLPFSLPAKGVTSVELLVRIGQLESPVDVTLINLEQGRRLASRKFSPNRMLDKGGVAHGDPSTTRMIVEVGPVPIGVASAEAGKSNELYYTQNVVSHISQVESLPTQSMAYESVDTVLLSTSRRDDWTGMRGDDPRIQALSDWVHNGGRLVLFCGENADLVLGANGPLTPFAPGPFAEMVTIDSLAPLMNYTGSNEPLPDRGRIKRAIPTFSQIAGDVDLTFGSRENPLPLIIRRRVGLGETVFVGLDIDIAPLYGPKSWGGRAQLLEKIIALPDEKLDDETSDYYYDGPADVALAMQEQLDEQLENSGIRTPSFLGIAALVLLYIVVIGPGDYFLVKHVLKRMELTWITFPLLIIGTCAAAYYYAAYLKGDSMRINQLEIVDVDNQTGMTRGTMWTHLFSPSPDRYNFIPAVKSPSGEADTTAESNLAWLGRPASGMGGMATEAGMLGGRPDYGWGTDLSQLNGVPIEVWSTKTFISRWETETDDLLASDLMRTPNNLVEGEITNATSATLEDCRLVYGNWAWKLGTMNPGDTVKVVSTGASNSSSAPRKLRNMYKQDHGFDVGANSYYEKQYLVHSLELRGLAEMMMFYDALGGRRYTHQWMRYQQYVDLSHALDSQTAMLIGACSAPRSELVRLRGDEAESLRNEKDVYVVMYRYVLPVNTSGEAPEEEPSSDE